MAFEIGGGIIIGGGIVIELTPGTPITANYICTELLEPLLTENSDNLITES
jgi:hypothetical protein